MIYLQHLMVSNMFGARFQNLVTKTLYITVAHGIKIIYQYRESAFYPAISWQLANQVQVWQLGEQKEHKKTVDSFDFQELEEPPIQRRIKWYKKYLPHYHELLPPDAYISKYEDLYGLETYQQRLAQFDNMIAYLDIEVDYNNVENFLGTDRRVLFNRQKSIRQDT